MRSWYLDLQQNWGVSNDAPLSFFIQALDYLENNNRKCYSDWLQDYEYDLTL